MDEEALPEYESDDTILVEDTKGEYIPNQEGIKSNFLPLLC